MTIRFSEEDVRPMGRATAGVRGMKLRSTDDGVVSCDVARDDGVLLFVSSSGTASAHRLPPSTGRAAAARVSGACGSPKRGVTWSRRSPWTRGDEILVFSSAGNIVRMGVDEISEQGRDATGVRVARLDEGDTVVAVAPVLEGDQNGDSLDPADSGDGDLGEEC